MNKPSTGGQQGILFLFYSKAFYKNRFFCQPTKNLTKEVNRFQVSVFTR